MTLDELLTALQLGEDQEVEFKSAAGGLPKSLWESVSALANTEGGTVVLGVTERHGGFALEPLGNPAAMRKAFWDAHNNPQKLRKEGHGRGKRYRWPLRAPQDLLSPVTDEPFQAATGEVTGEVKAVLAELNGEMSRTQLQGRLKLTHEDHFRKAYLLPAMRAGLVAMTIPDKPKSRLQKYKLTAAGKQARAQTEPKNKK